MCLSVYLCVCLSAGLQIKRITKHHVTVHYFGDTFLGVYGLMDTGQAGEICTETFRHGHLVFLHWGFQLQGKCVLGGGRLGVRDQMGLSQDPRIPWKYSAPVKKRKRSNHDDGNDDEDESHIESSESH